MGEAILARNASGGGGGKVVTIEPWSGPARYHQIPAAIITIPEDAVEVIIGRGENPLEPTSPGEVLAASAWGFFRYSKDKSTNTWKKSYVYNNTSGYWATNSGDFSKDTSEVTAVSGEWQISFPATRMTSTSYGSDVANYGIGVYILG